MDWIQALYFTDSENGYAAGWLVDMQQEKTTAQILKTTNGGKTWEETLTGVEGMLSSICFYNNLNGWAAGYNYDSKKEVLLNTTNGGKHWDCSNCGLDSEIYTIQFIDERTGWFAGNGMIYKSTNGGQSFFRVDKGVKQIIQSSK